MHEEVKPSTDLSAAAERRGAARYPCRLPLSWRALDTEDVRSGTAHVCDISTLGVGLILTGRVRPGEVLAIRLHCRNARLVRPMPVRVLYALDRESDTWRVGCCFIRPLSQLELRAILDES
jgi:hypothetical protein